MEDGPGAEIERLRDELASARAEIADLEHRLADASSLRLRATRAVRRRLLRADAMVRRALEQASAPAPAVLRAPTDPADPADPADAAVRSEESEGTAAVARAAVGVDRRTLEALANAPRSERAMQWDRISRRAARLVDDTAAGVLRRLRLR